MKTVWEVTKKLIELVLRSSWAFIGIPVIGVLMVAAVMWEAPVFDVTEWVWPARLALVVYWAIVVWSLADAFKKQKEKGNA